MIPIPYSLPGQVDHKKAELLRLLQMAELLELQQMLAKMEGQKASLVTSTTCALFATDMLCVLTVMFLYITEG